MPPVVHQQQSVVTIGSKVAKQERIRTEHRPFDSLLLAEHPVFASKSQQVAVQREGFDIALPLAPVQLAHLERAHQRRIFEMFLHCRDAGKLTEELGPAVADRSRKLRLLIGKIQKWL